MPHDQKQVLSLWQKEFVEVEKAMGASHLRIMLLHILPSCSHCLIIRFCTGISGTILSAATTVLWTVVSSSTILPMRLPTLLMPNWQAWI